MSRPKNARLSADAGIHANGSFLEKQMPGKPPGTAPRPASLRWAWLGLGLLLLLSPLGLLAPGTAWGEWSAQEVRSMTGLLPEGMKRWDGWWHALFPDYSVPAWGQNHFIPSAAGYVFSASVGVLLTIGAVWLLGRWLARH